MKFGFRIPSFKKKLAARTSWKRVVRHKMGFKMPKGMGMLTDPKKALYNKVYRMTTVGVEDMLSKRSKAAPKGNAKVRVRNQEPPMNGMSNNAIKDQLSQMAQEYEQNG